MPMPVRIAIAALAFWLCGNACVAQAAPMSASEIRATILGHELCTAKSGGLFADLIFCFTYRKDGSFKMTNANLGEVANWVFETDQICLFKVNNPKEKSCAAFERVGEKRFKVNGKDTVCLGACED